MVSMTLFQAPCMRQYGLMQRTRFSPGPQHRLWPFWGAASGAFKDVSNMLGSQTLTLGEMGSQFDHATAVGDLNHDGRDDIFSGNNLWVSTPDGRWQDATAKVQELVPKNMSPMSLAIGDLNNDKANDILVLYPDFHSDRIVLFNDAASGLAFTRTVLPSGLYGANTKDNFP